MCISAASCGRVVCSVFPGRRMLRRLSCLWTVAACLALVPVAAIAQARQPFAVAVVELSEALVGEYGDERDSALAALEAMQRSLRQWDHEVRVVETQVTEGLPTAAPDVVMPMHLGLALTYRDRGRRADALAALERGIGAAPADARAHQLQGLVQLPDDPAMAAAAFRRAWELEPRDVVTAYWLVQTAYRSGDPAQAHGAGGTLAAMSRQIATAETQEPTTPFDDQSLFRDGAPEAPIFPLVRYQEGFAHLAAGEYDRAVASLREAAAADPLLIDAALRSEPMQRGIAALREGHGTAAAGHFAAAAGLSPDSSEVHRMLGAAWAAAGRVEESRASLETSLRLDMRNERTHLSLIGLLDAAGLRRDADGALQRGLEALPTSGALRWFAAVRSHHAGDEDEALRQLESVPLSAMLVGKGYVLAEIGRLHGRAGRTQAAIDAWQRLVLADPNNLMAHLTLGELYRREGLVAPALASFVAALLVAPDLAAAHTGVGYVHLAAGALEDAVVSFRRAVSLRPDDADPRYGLASALGRLGRTEEAAAELEAARRIR